MRVTSESNSGPPSRTPSIMDSPTLVRVERARLRQEADSAAAGGGSQREDSLERCLLDPKVSSELDLGGSQCRDEDDEGGIITFREIAPYRHRLAQIFGTICARPSTPVGVSNRWLEVGFAPKTIRSGRRHGPSRQVCLVSSDSAASKRSPVKGE
uniref:Uncharacterized protein n=1 Tax=Anopheles farauti TaxID=69004 RepID=A0A182QGG5_9DIPT